MTSDSVSQDAKITSGNIGAILGHSKYRSPDSVLRNMVRQYHGAESEYVENPAAKHAQMNKRRAILAFMKSSGLSVDECGSFSYGDRIEGKPDGIASDGGILKIRVPFGLRNGGEFIPLVDQDQYYHEMQLNMLASNKTHGYFVQYIAPKGDPFSHDYVDEKISIDSVEKDPQWLDDVLPHINDFYAKYKKELNNKEHLEPLRKVIDSVEADILVNSIMELRWQAKEAKEKEQKLMVELVSLAGGVDADVSGRKLTKVVRKGAIAYAKAMQDLAPDADLEQWRGEGSESWRLT